jgi:hypothetical protein
MAKVSKEEPLERNRRLKGMMLRNKEMNVVLEKERTLKIKAESRLREMGSDAGQWKGKFGQLERKLGEEKVKNGKYQSDLNKSVRIIGREAGEFSSFDELLEGEGWRARAQEIGLLQNKVKDLQALNQTWSDMVPTYPTVPMGKSGSQYYKNKETLGDTAAKRRKDLEDAKTQHQEISDSFAKIKEKIKGQTSRNKLLQDEIRGLKIDYQTNKQVLIEKNDNDTRYITALKGEVVKMRKEIDRMRKNPPGVETRVVYKNREDSQPTGLLNLSAGQKGSVQGGQQELALKDKEIAKKEKMIRDLINEKMRIEEECALVRFENDKDEDMEKLVAQLAELRRDKDELLRISCGGSKFTDSYETIKDLSGENSKLRMKISDLETKLFKK